MTCRPCSCTRTLHALADAVQLAKARRASLILERQSLVIGIDDDGFVVRHVAGQQLLGQVVQDVALDGALHRAGTELGIISHLAKEVDGIGCPFQGKALFR